MIFKGMPIATILGLSLATSAFAGAPDWVKEPVRKSGQHVFVSCKGEAAERSLAYRLALNECKAIAAEQINSEFTSRSILVETESDTALHTEISSAKQVHGLDCLDAKEYVEEKDDTVRLFLRCRFDSKVAKIVSKDDTKEENNSVSEEKSETQVFVQEPQKHDGEFSRKGIISSSTRSVILSTVPPCKSVTIVSKFPRVIRCKSIPVTFKVDPTTDKELIIRGPKHLKSQHIDLRKQRKPASEPGAIRLEVYFE